jgi:uncharacterized radical SAM protein YgiQ
VDIQQAKHNRMEGWLPTSVKEMNELGWEEPDVIFFSGDAYIDHPSFGTAVIARWLEHLGLRVAIVPQPNWRDDLRDFRKFGHPRMFFAVSAGNMDSMVNHYTANRRLRSDDAFTSAGKAGSRPDYAVTVYTRILKDIYPDVPVVIGGIEASLRRLAHYDYWSDSFKRSVLLDSGADLLIYGMGEKPMQEMVCRLKAGESFDMLTNIRQTCYRLEKGGMLPETDYERTIELIDYEKCLKDKINYARNFKIEEEESNRIESARLIEPYADCSVVVNPPFASYAQQEIDAPYELPYQRMPHPRYRNKGDIPAYEMIRNSVNIHRGCFGGCSFCTISAHQGKQVLSRSEESVLKEVEKVVATLGFHGNLSDLGGPSANMYKMKGKDHSLCMKCKRASCIFPSVCSNLNASHKALTNLYQKARNINGVRRIYIGSGVRYDLFYGLKDKENEREAMEYLRELVLYHVSGRLKVAPEHSSPDVVKLMRKPSFELYLKLRADFEHICNDAGMRQQVIPYLISSHPGCELKDMAQLMRDLQNIGYRPEQAQDFTPTPMTLATTMFYTGVNPYSMKPVFVAKTPEEKKRQQLFLFYYKPENRDALQHEIRLLSNNSTAPKEDFYHRRNRNRKR